MTKDAPTSIAALALVMSRQEECRKPALRSLLYYYTWECYRIFEYCLPEVDGLWPLNSLNITHVDREDAQRNQKSVLTTQGLWVSDVGQVKRDKVKERHHNAYCFTVFAASAEYILI
jgi:hypothetical protein